MSSLIQKYQQLIDKKQIVKDEVQLNALKELQKCYETLCKQQSFIGKLFGKKTTSKGLYLWGSVGLGKTFLMDLFYNTLPFENKMRSHFHKFMQNIQLSLREHQGKTNPLEIIASEIASKARVLCFDEFFVHDIADAMILERLFTKLFEKGIVLIATSNIAPKDLYAKGLHHRRFLPAIKLIEQHCIIHELQADVDYRFKEQAQEKVYFLTKIKSSIDEMYQCFLTASAQNRIEKDSFIRVEGREIPVLYLSKTAIWFDFKVICHTPRSQVDYLKIAQKFSTVFVSNVPKMTEKDKLSITYFIYLVDIFYDNQTKLLLSIKDDIDKLYVKGDKAFEYQRTISRLNEMKSRKYQN